MKIVKKCQRKLDSIGRLVLCEETTSDACVDCISSGRPWLVKITELQSGGKLNSGKLNKRAI